LTFEIMSLPGGLTFGDPFQESGVVGFEVKGLRFINKRAGALQKKITANQKKIHQVDCPARVLRQMPGMIPGNLRPQVQQATYESVSHETVMARC